MNGRSLMAPACICVEIGQSSMRALNGTQGFQQPLERLPNGRLTTSCKDRLSKALQSLLERKLWSGRTRVFCAVGARGVSLRRLSLPASVDQDLRQHLLLQIEAEFPLPPDELAWGYLELPSANVNGVAAAKREFLIVALRKDQLEDYAEVFASCGAVAVFTVAAISRNSICPRAPSDYAILDIGLRQSELVVFHEGVPTMVRAIAWGGENVTKVLAEHLGIPLAEAEKLKLESGSDERVQTATDAALATLVGALNGRRTITRLFLSGRSASSLVGRLEKLLGPASQCTVLQSGSADGHSAGLLGLKADLERDGGPAIVLQLKADTAGTVLSQPAPRKWAAVAAALALAALLIPSVGAVVLQPFLARKLASIKTESGRLATIERELRFLQYLKQTQPPYLDALYVMAKAAPPGTRIDSLTMNQRGDLSFKGAMGGSQAVVDFRTKLIDSGFFARVSVEEQTPTPDRQRVNVRMSAEWKPAGFRPPVSDPPANPEVKPPLPGPKPVASPTPAPTPPRPADATPGKKE